MNRGWWRRCWGRGGEEKVEGNISRTGGAGLVPDSGAGSDLALAATSATAILALSLSQANASASTTAGRPRHMPRLRILHTSL
jgi:hypothetical protein